MSSRPSRPAPTCAPHPPRPATFPTPLARDRSPRAPRLWLVPSLHSCCTPYEGDGVITHSARGDRVIGRTQDLFLSPYHPITLGQRQARKANQLRRDRRDD